MKLESEDILEEISSELFAYLKAGTIDINSFFNKLPLEINNIEQLLKVHFILYEEVFKFVRKLPENLRRIKTSTEKNIVTFNSKVKGKINWKDTLKKRYQRNYLDRTVFSCMQKNKNFNIKENLVLKSLLDKIYNILVEEIDLTKNYNWLSKWAYGEKLYNKFTEIYSRNIYLNKIDADNIPITSRMINDTKKSRNKLYRKAAELLSLYHKLTRPSYWQEGTIKKEIINLLKKTFIIPDSEDVLFELYWVFKLLRNYDNVKYNIIDGSNNLVASWVDSDFNYALYHDSEGSKNLKFQIKLNEIKNSNSEYLKRFYKSKTLFVNYTNQIFGNEKLSSFWKGRPDIILEVRDKKNNNLGKIYIGEIKNTTSVEYAEEGLKELLDYMSFVKNNHGYINSSELNNDKIKGLLLLNDVNVLKTTVGNIKVCSVRK